MKAMGEAAANGVGGSASAVGGSETGRHRSYEVAYPATRKPTALDPNERAPRNGCPGWTPPPRACPDRLSTR